MDPNATDQEREIRDLIRRAERTPVKTSPLASALSSFSAFDGHAETHGACAAAGCAETPVGDRAYRAFALKKIAAGNITKFFKDFPELDEDAINAIYDLCEDHDPKVCVLALAVGPLIRCMSRYASTV